ncbi:hypothetical protein EON64_08360 [archaeon]|nr:MAG: hypothetical protein EON64_08360 [archaeon]
MSGNPKPIGRSVEEVILLRKLQQSAALTLPAIKMSTSMSQLPSTANLGSRKGDRRSANPNAVYSEEDVRRMMEEVTSYTRTLQNRIKVNPGISNMHLKHTNAHYFYLFASIWRPSSWLCPATRSLEAPQTET